ncbi:MAG: hypothetical protein ACLPKB_25400 [Xanthobacteraceae bacterium]
MHIKLFISAVTKEFGSYRDALRRLLQRHNVTVQVQVQVQEDFIAGGLPTLDKLDLYIKGCDAVIHIAGDMTGSWAKQASLDVIKGRYGDLAARLPELKSTLDTGHPKVSYTQWEAYLAVYHRKELLIAVPEPGAPRDATYVKDAEQQTSQQSHLARLQAHERFEGIRFASSDQLALGLFRSTLYDLLTRAGIPSPEPRPRRKPIDLHYASIGTLFKGREAFVADLRKSLARVADGAAASAICNAVYGLGGIGKTRLAVEYAWQHRDEYSALLLVFANTPADLRRNLAALVGPLVLDLPEQKVEDEEVRVAAALRWLQQNPGWFLIFDNVDTEEAAAEVEKLLARLHGGQVLITSRLSNWSALVDRLDLDVLSDGASVAYLLERTEKRRRKAPDDEAQARVLAGELGHLALGLAQAGAYIDKHRLSFTQYLAEWHANREAVLKWSDARLMQDYERSVAVTWLTSVTQLDKPARHLLDRLAWLASEPIPEALLDSAVLGERDDAGDQRAALVELEAYSLVTRAPPAFTVHRLVQEVTRRSLKGEAGRAALISSLAWIEHAFGGDENDLRLRPMLDSLVPHVRAVTDRAEAAGVSESTAGLLMQLGDVLGSRVPLGGIEPFYRRALAICDRLAQADLNNAGWQRDLSVSYNKVGDVQVAQGNLPEALKSFRDSLAIRDRLAQADPNNAGWQRDLAVSNERLGDIYAAQSQGGEAKSAFERALAIYTELLAEYPDNTYVLVSSTVPLMRLGELNGKSGRLYYEKALKILRQLDDAGRLEPRRKPSIARIEERLAKL